MPNYKNGKIYKVVCSESNRVYIGSTTQRLSARIYKHKHKSNQCMTKSFIEPKIYLIEDYPCDRKEQLLMRERHFFELLECVNKCSPLKDKEKSILRHRVTSMIIYEKNREKILARNKEKIVCDCGKTMTRNYLSKHKKRYCKTLNPLNKYIVF